MSQPKQGLFAFQASEVLTHFQDRPDLDHAAWFESGGLPSHGPGYDAILRGKVSYDADVDLWRLGFYTAAYLSDARFQRIVEAFGLDAPKVVEKRLVDAGW